MKDHGLRRYAGPFDWIFSNPEMVAHCVEDDFRRFLDRDQHVVALGQGKGTATHRFYGAVVKHGVIFNHHDPVHNPEDHAYFVRCVERFRTVLSAASKSDAPHRTILFLLVGKKPLELGAMRALFDVVCGHCAAPFELLGIGMRRAGRDDRPGVELVAHHEVTHRGSTSTMRVYLQRCCAGHTGVYFNDRRDADTFGETILRNPSSSAEGAVGANDAPHSRRRFDLEDDPLPPKSIDRRTAVTMLAGGEAQQQRDTIQEARKARRRAKKEAKAKKADMSRRRRDEVVI